MRELKPDDTVNNRYRVLRKLGSGAMGSVYLCEDGVENRIKVALKVLVSDNLSDQDVWAKGEYEALTRLRHPNLARVYNFGRIEGTKDYFIVSEFIKGIDLFAATDYLNYEEITEIVVQICRALEYIHSQGYVHFDIKPDNILVTRHKTVGLKEGSKVQYDSVDLQRSSRGLCEKPVVKLIDFGLAERITGSFSFAIKGTLNYLAPEILNGATPDRRADLYSLGVTIYQIVNRDLPFYQDLMAFGESGVAAKRSEIFEANMKKHPAYLRDLILRLIAERPEERFQSARDVIQLINKVSNHSFELETEETRASYFHSPRLVGRKREMNLLKRYYEEIFCRDAAGQTKAAAPAPAPAAQPEGEGGAAAAAEEGAADFRARLIVVDGEMGSGKSRLLEEFRHFLKLNGFNVYTGNCYEASHKAYQPFVEVLRQVIYCAGLESDLVKKYQDVLLKLLPGLQKKENEAPKQPMGLEKDKYYFIDKVSQLLIEAAEASPFIMVINNLQWMDEVSVDVFEKVIECLLGRLAAGSQLRLLVLASQRVEEQSSERLKGLIESLKTQGFCLEMQLRRLKHEQIAEFLQSMLGLSEVPDEFVTQLEEQTGGNPLFLVETLKALEDAGIIKNQADGWTIKRTKYNTVEIPQRMEDLLLQRLNRLEAHKRQLLETMAVLDKPVNPKFLQAFRRFRETPILSGLRDLEAAGIISKQFENGKLQFHIEQTKIREILYTALKDEDRRRYHGDVVETFETVYGGREEEILEELAFHYQRSDKTEKAMKLALKAGDRLKAIFANERAFDYYQYVLEQAVERPESVEMLLEVREKLGDICTSMGRYESAVEHYSTLLDVEYCTVLAPERVTTLHLRRGKVYEIQGDYDSALKCYKEARNHLSTFGTGDHVVERARVYNSIGWVYVCLGKYEKAMTISLEALRVLEGMAECIEHAMIYSTIGSANYFKGNIREAVKYHRQSLEIKEHLEDIAEIAISLNNLGSAFLAGGEFGEAADHFARALATSEEVGDPYGLALTMHNLSRLWSAVGDQERATAYLDRSIREAKLYNMRHLNLQNYILRGAILKEQGDYSKAEGFLFRVLTAYSKQGNRAGLCAVLLEISSLYRLAGNRQEARSTVEEARRYCEDLVIQPLKARCLLEQARQVLLGENPDAKGAARSLEQALEIAAKCDHPEIAAEVGFQLAEALVVAREVSQAERYYKQAREQFREMAESLPAELKEPYERRLKERFQAWRGTDAPPSRPASGSSARAAVGGGARSPSGSGRPPESPDTGGGEPARPLPSSGASPERVLRVMHELLGVLPKAAGLNPFLSQVVEAVIGVCGADVGFLLSLSGKNLAVKVALENGGARPSLPGKFLSLPLIHRALKQGQPVLLSRADSKSSSRDLALLAECHSHTVAILPFLEPNGQRGALYLVNSRLTSTDANAWLLSLQPIVNLVPMAYLQFQSAADVIPQG
jgi:serine/threonine protein kinase/tetratricopeptide (TPR) repeat protein